MIKIDLITGFLGSGKTTFIKKYASYLLKKGMNIGILENDFGAVNVDMMLLQDLMGDNCELEMVSGGRGLKVPVAIMHCEDLLVAESVLRNNGFQVLNRLVDPDGEAEA